MNDRLDQIDWDITFHAVIDNGEPMSWNLFLAFLPLALSSVLFHQPQSPIVRWGIWLLLGITAAGSYAQFQTMAQAIAQSMGQNPWVRVMMVILLALGLGITCLYRHQPHFKTLIWQGKRKKNRSVTC